MLSGLVTADDLGYSSERDAGIFCAFRAGCISRASLLVSGASALSALCTARAVRLPVGLHLNLTEGVPVLGALAGSLLAPGTCEMRGKAGFRAALARGEIALPDVAAEAKAQLARYTALDPTHALPPYWDGHQHVHVLPGVAAVLATVIGGAGVCTVRIPVWAGSAVEPLDHLDAPAAESAKLGKSASILAEGAGAAASLNAGAACALARASDAAPGASSRRAFYMSVSADAEAARAVFAAAGVMPLADTFVGFGLSGADCTVARARSVLVAATALGGTVEWMAHPGFRTRPRPLGNTARSINCAHEDSYVGTADAPLTFSAERAAALACAEDGAGCGGSSGPDDFSQSWERERELAILLTLVSGSGIPAAAAAAAAAEAGAHE